MPNSNFMYLLLEYQCVFIYQLIGTKSAKGAGLKSNLLKTHLGHYSQIIISCMV